MKICLKKYPMNSFKGQKSEGRDFDGILYENLETLADAIVRDNTFLGIISSSTLEVGTGKSSFAQQIGEAWCDIMYKKHQIELDTTMQNVVFKPQDLIERSFTLPKYSFILLDEWEEANYWSQLGMTLRQFFRKCRQLNLFMIIICPNFFQVPMSYAISRSVFFIDVRFESGFERGFFSFYNFKKKKDLYVKGKKLQDYSVVRCDFYGRFTSGYAVPEEEYREAKRKDMIEAERKPKEVDEKEILVKMFKQIYNNFPKKKVYRITIKDLAHAFGIHERTGQRWVAKEYEEINNEDANENEENSKISEGKNEKDTTHEHNQ